WDLRTMTEYPATTPSGAPVYVGELFVGLAVPAEDGAPAAWMGVPAAIVARHPELRSWIEEYTGSPLHLAPLELAGLLLPWPPSTGPTSVVDLLDPIRAITPFTGQTELIDRLVGWCHSGAALSGRLLVGPPGRGKTRIARHLAQRLHDDGWLVG